MDLNIRLRQNLGHLVFGHVLVAVVDHQRRNDFAAQIHFVFAQNDAFPAALTFEGVTFLRVVQKWVAILLGDHDVRRASLRVLLLLRAEVVSVRRQFRLNRVLLKGFFANHIDDVHGEPNLVVLRGHGSRGQRLTISQAIVAAAELGQGADFEIDVVFAVLLGWRQFDLRNLPLLELVLVARVLDLLESLLDRNGSRLLPLRPLEDALIFGANLGSRSGIVFAHEV